MSKSKSNRPPKVGKSAKRAAGGGFAVPAVRTAARMGDGGGVVPSPKRAVGGGLLIPGLNRTTN